MKIVFLVNSLQNQRCIKRINGFISKGCGVEVYAYSRLKDSYSDYNFKPHILGTMPNEMSYTKRLPILLRDINGVVRDNKGQDVIYYLFGLDLAMIFRLFNRRSKYVYEESDLVHTYVGNIMLKRILEKIDKWIILHSEKTVFTSEGFERYHFGKVKPVNTLVIANKLNQGIMKMEAKEKTISDKIRVGFVGKPRFKSVVAFAKVLCKRYKNYEFHVYGGPILEEIEGFESLSKFDNYFYHGPFKNPDDLPEIYSSLDLVLSTYDIEFENVRYAEPNKLYEAIYFRTPIIVSENTFLGEKVKSMEVGCCVNPLNENDVAELLESINQDRIRNLQYHCEAIDKNECVDSFDDFIEEVKSLTV